MKEQNEKEKKKPRMNKERKFYLFTAIGCAVALLAVIVVAVAVTNAGNISDDEALRGSNSPSATMPNSSADTPNSSADDPNSSGGGGNSSIGGGDSSSDEPVVVVPDEMGLPVAIVNVCNDYGFYHNKTLNCYYEHEGIDFTAEVGAEVRAVKDGVVESIFRDDILLGTEIVVDHGDGMKTLYRFVDADENLTVGAEVKKGDVIATVAEASGNEYKDGAHLHFEITVSGENVDPALHLTLEEK